MARRRTVEVRESIEELQQLREYYTGTRNEGPIHLLLLLKEDITRTIPECAEICGISARKAERVWKAYREGGMSGVVRSASSKEIKNLSHVKEETHSTSSWNTVLNQIGKVLDSSGDEGWMREFRSLLYYLFPEADYIVFRCLTFGDDTNGEVPSSVIAHKMHLPNGDSRLVVPNAFHGPRSAADYFQLARKIGLNLSEFEKSPKIIEIFLDERESGNANRHALAQIVLFRKIDSERPSLGTQSREEIIRPFLTSILTHLCVKPIPSTQTSHVRDVAIETISRSRSLTQTEKRVFSLLLSGKSNQAIADLLSASVSTVKSHLSSIYQKLDVSGKGEAVALLIGMLDKSGVTRE